MKKVLFYVLFAVVTFVVTLSLLSQRLDSNYMIERDITINAPIDQVYAEVGDLKKWPEWSPWHKRDPSVEYKYEGDSSTGVGGSVTWKGKESGSGTMTITESSAPNLFSYAVKFDGSSDIPTGEFHFVDMANTVKVVWTMRGNRGFIDKIFWTLFRAEDAIKKDFDEGLQLLKAKMEVSK